MIDINILYHDVAHYYAHYFRHGAYDFMPLDLYEQYTLLLHLRRLISTLDFA